MRSAARGAAAGLVVAALAFAVVAGVSAGPSIRRSVPVYPTQLPTGAGREIAQQGCLVCHSATLITQQHKDSTSWEKTVKLMEAWGAPVPVGAHGTLIGYLTRHLGPRSPRSSGK